MAVRHLILTAVAGGYALSGSSATKLVRTRTLPASQGAYALSPNAATIKRGRWLVAVQGAYASQPGGWLALGMPAFKGSYALAGNSAALAAHLSLHAACGAYVSTGKSATFNYETAPPGSGTFGFGPGIGTLLTQAHPP